MTGCWSALSFILYKMLLYADQPGVTDEEQSWFPERSLDLVGEGARGEASSNRRTTHIPGHQVVKLDLLSITILHRSLPCKLKDSPLSLRSTGDNEHIQRILNLYKAISTTRKCAQTSITHLPDNRTTL